MRHLYVYYRIDPTQAAAAARTVDALLARLAPYCATPPRRLARCDEPELWMEVYEGIADFPAFMQLFDNATRVFSTQAWLLGERHRECFYNP